MKNKKTYIIDDDKISLKLMSLLISRNGFSEEINAFLNAQTALDELKKNCSNIENLPDVILLDLNMPVMDGWQFLDAFIHLPMVKDISVFIVTSSIDPVDIEMSKKYDKLKGYIMKPITAEKLKSMTNLIGVIL